MMLLWTDKINIYYISDPANNLPYLVYLSWDEILYYPENEIFSNMSTTQFLCSAHNFMYNCINDMYLNSTEWYTLKIKITIKSNIIC